MRLEACFRNDRVNATKLRAKLSGAFDRRRRSTQAKPITRLIGGAEQVAEHESTLHIRLARLSSGRAKRPYPSEDTSKLRARDIGDRHFVDRRQEARASPSRLLHYPLPREGY